MLGFGAVRREEPKEDIKRSGGAYLAGGCSSPAKTWRRAGGCGPAVAESSPRERAHAGG